MTDHIDARTRRPGGSHASVAGLVAFLALVLTFYGWTAATNERRFPTQLDVDGRDYFNLLTDSFLRGEVALGVEPSPELLALDDPYDPTRNYLAHRRHDLSLFEDRYYLYWGPTPALTLFAPYRFAGFGDLPERAAVTVYCFGGFVGSLLVFRWLVRRYVPGTPGWVLAAGAVALATGNLAPFLLRRPTVYEVAISAAFCFSFLSIHLLLTGGLRDRPSLVHLVGSGVLFALAIGARPSVVVAGLLHLAVLVVIVRRDSLRRRTWAVAAALAAPTAAAVALLLAYNQARFGSLLEFGLRYQLNDVKPYPEGWDHVLPTLYLYLLAPPRFALEFPFVHLPPPPLPPQSLPPRYNLERVGGVLTTLPIVLFALAAIPWATRGAGRQRQLGRVVVVFASVGAATVLALAVSILAASWRYAVDFSAHLVLAGLVSWIALAQRTERRARTAVRLAGAVAIAYGAVIVLATSLTGTTNGLQKGRPEVFASLERWSEPVPAVAASLAGRPMLVEVEAPLGVAADVRYGRVDIPKASFAIGSTPTTVVVAVPREMEVVLRGTFVSAGAEAQVVASGGATVRVPAGAAVEAEVRVPVSRGTNRVVLRVDGAIDDGSSPDVVLVSVVGLDVSGT